MALLVYHRAAEELEAALASDFRGLHCHFGQGNCDLAGGVMVTNLCPRRPCNPELPPNGCAPF